MVLIPCVLTPTLVLLLSSEQPSSMKCSTLFSKKRVLREGLLLPSPVSLDEASQRAMTTSGQQKRLSLASLRLEAICPSQNGMQNLFTTQCQLTSLSVKPLLGWKTTALCIKSIQEPVSLKRWLLLVRNPNQTRTQSVSHLKTASLIALALSPLESLANLFVLLGRLNHTSQRKLSPQSKKPRTTLRTVSSPTLTCTKTSGSASLVPSA